MTTTEVMFRGKLEKIATADFIIRHEKGTVRVITNRNLINAGLEDMNFKKVKIVITVEE
ncbi:MAG: hypothetical protein IMZ64_08675 [Bacteroidetes bacterium]|nr:hypothetical protein [Bacteroidota bacterium]